MNGDLNRVALFVRVAEAGGVTAAAKKLKLPKSSVSRNLTQLEAELGVELVVRGTRRFELTAPGQSFFDAVANQIGAVEAAREDVRKETEEPNGLVRVAAPPPFAQWVLAPAVTRFVRRYPRVRVDLCTNTSPDPLHEGFDLAIVIGKLRDSSAKVRSLGTVECGLFASTGYLAERGRPRRPSDLQKHTCILLRSTSDRWTLDGKTGPTIVDVAGPIRVDDESTAIGVAVADGGIVVMPLHYPASAPGSGVLERVLPDYAVRGVRAQLIYVASRHVPSRISLLCDAIMSSVSTTCPKAS